MLYYTVLYSQKYCMHFCKEDTTIEYSWLYFCAEWYIFDRTNCWALTDCLMVTMGAWFEMRLATLGRSGK